MPVLPNTRHERFAQGVADGMSSVAAYGEAGYKRLASHASRLRAHPRVQARIAELQKDLEQHFAMRRIDWLEALRRIAGKAEDEKDYAAARAALREIGLAMLRWYAPDEKDRNITAIIKKL